MKAQILADMKTDRILSADFCAGSKHNFRLFKESRIELPPYVLLLADAGYQGLTGIHPNSETPFKKTKLHPLNNEQKASNRALSQQRIMIDIFSANSKCFAFYASVIETGESVLLFVSV